MESTGKMLDNIQMIKYPRNEENVDHLEEEKERVTGNNGWDNISNTPNPHFMG